MSSQFARVWGLCMYMKGIDRMWDYGDGMVSFFGIYCIEVRAQFMTNEMGAMEEQKGRIVMVTHG